MSKLASLVIALLILLCSCVQRQNATSVALVDVEKVMGKSLVAKAGVEHLKKVALVLESAKQEVEMRLAILGEEEAEVEMLKAQTVLQKQMHAAQEGVSKVVGKMLFAAVHSWRKEHKDCVVIARQGLLEADAVWDISQEILQRIDAAGLPDFGPLPVISIGTAQELKKSRSKK